jgi:metal-responsive CopG/Arc/MetJ family transcriptional regulator
MMLSQQELKKIRSEAIQSSEISLDLKQSAVELILKSIKTALQKYKHIEVIVLKGQTK